MTNIAIDLFKYLGIFIGSISGVIGLFVEFRDKTTGKVTRKGYLILMLILSAGFVSVVLQTLEIYKERNESIEASKKALDQARQNNAILTNLNRTLNPIKDVYLTYRIEVADCSPEMMAYRQRLAEDCRQISGDLTASGQRLLEKRYGISAVMLLHDSVKQIAITEESSMFPSRESEKVVYNALYFSSLSVAFYKDSVPAGYPDTAKGDLGFPYIMTSIGPAGTNGPHSLHYDISSGKLSLWAYHIPSDSKY